jgi:hypothetical protein
MAQYMISVNAISVVWSGGTGRSDLELWALGRSFANAVVLCREPMRFAFSPRMYVRHLLQRVNLGERVLFFAVLRVDFAWKRWKIGIGHRLRFFDCCFYAEFDINGRILG